MPPPPDAAGALLRPYEGADAAALARLFHRAVHEGAAPLYTEAERRAWSPGEPSAAAWARRLSGLWTLVAEAGAGAGPVGFMSLRPADGCLDLAFVAPEWQRTGLAARLLAGIEDEARRRGLAQLHSEASHLARPFLERHGWQLEATQQVERRGIRLTNHRMRRDLLR